MAEPRGLLRSLDSPAVVPRRVRRLLALLLVPYLGALWWFHEVGGRALTPFPPFVTAHAMAMFIVAGITSILLFNQAAVPAGGPTPCSGRRIRRSR